MLTQCPNCSARFDSETLTPPGLECPECGVSLNESLTTFLSGISGESQVREELLVSSLDWRDTMLQIAKVEETWMQTLAAASEVEISSEPDLDPQAQFNRELKPLFERATQQLQAFDTPTSEQAKALEFLKLRSAAWQALWEAVHQQDPHRHTEYVQLWEASQELVADIYKDQFLAKVEREKDSAFLEYFLPLKALVPRLIVTPVLFWLNVLVFVIMVSSGVGFLHPNPKDLHQWGGCTQFATINGEWWRLVTSQFLHSGILHLGLNMLALWSFAVLVERLFGRTGFLLIYALTGMTASLFSLWAHVDEPKIVVSVGASGAICGLVGAWVAYLIRCRSSIPRPAYLMFRRGILWILGLNIALGFMVSNIDVAGHAGGFIPGMILGWVLAQPVSREMLRKRTPRNLLATTLGIVMCVGLYLSLPDSLPDPRVALEELNHLDQELRDRFNHLVDRLEQKEIRDAETLQILESEILPLVIDLRKRTRETVEIWERLRPVFDPYEQNLGVFQESIELFIRGIQESRKDLIQQAWNKQAEFNRREQELDEARKQAREE